MLVFTPYSVILYVMNVIASSYEKAQKLAHVLSILAL